MCAIETTHMLPHDLTGVGNGGRSSKLGHVEEESLKRVADTSRITHAKGRCLFGPIAMGTEAHRSHLCSTGISTSSANDKAKHPTTKPLVVRTRASELTSKFTLQDISYLLLGTP